MIERILPSTVSAVESTSDIDGVLLFPEEAAAVASATPRRRREFATTRACAHRALTALGVAAGPIRRGEGGAPIWPAGVVGSMTHCTGYRAAVAAHRDDVASVGIDAEPHRPLRHGLLEVLAVPRERAQLAALHRVDPAMYWDRILFSAKESLFKAWFPVSKQWLDFADAVVTLQPRQGWFDARLRIADQPEVTGRWLVDRGLVLTSVLLPVGPPPAGRRPDASPALGRRRLPDADPRALVR